MRRHCRAKAVIKTMHELPIKDAIMRNPRLRKDGRMVHDFLSDAREDAGRVEES
jgi:hypothetical protein